MNTFFISKTYINRQSEFVLICNNVDRLMDVKARKQRGDVVLGILDVSFEKKNICMYI